MILAGGQQTNNNRDRKSQNRHSHVGNSVYLFLGSGGPENNTINSGKKNGPINEAEKTDSFYV